MQYLALLICCQIFIKVFAFMIENPDLNVFSYGFSVGWGICNEAGIMLCVCMPFVFSTLIQEKKNFNAYIQCSSLVRSRRSM